MPGVKSSDSIIYILLGRCALNKTDSVIIWIVVMSHFEDVLYQALYFDNFMVKSRYCLFKKNILHTFQKTLFYSNILYEVISTKLFDAKDRTANF